MPGVAEMIGRAVLNALRWMATGDGVQPYAHPAFAQDSDETLKHCLVQEHPELGDPRVEDWSKVNWLREWVYLHVPDASFSLCLDAGHRSVWDAAVRDILRRLAVEKRGFKCAGASLVLYKLCNLFGYEACVYNVGDASTSRVSHAVTLVEVRHGSTRRVGVLDPYFNYSLEDGEGGPVDFRRTIDLLVRHKVEDVRIARRPRRRVMMMTPADRERITRLGAWFIRPRDGLLFCAYDSTIDAWLRDHPEASRWLHAHVRKKNPLYLLLFPLGIHGDTSFLELDEWVRDRRKAAGIA